MIRIGTNWIRNIRIMSSSAACPALSEVPDVDIDANGKFKYILIKLSAPSEGDKEIDKLLVRGYANCNFHTDINNTVLQELQKLREKGSLPECSTKVLGGGKIIHDSSKKTIKVYGESQGYGKADHATTASLLKNVYNDYEISWSDEAS